MKNRGATGSAAILNSAHENEDDWIVIGRTAPLNRLTPGAALQGASGASLLSSSGPRVERIS